MPEPLSASRWTAVQNLFFAVADLPLEEQQSCLDAACGGDRELRAAVLGLLRSDAGSDTAIFAAVGAEAEAADRDESPDAQPLTGMTLGHWRVERELGRGGMSVVYLGSRADGEFNKSVALKLIRRGMDTEAVVARLRRERGILAALDHPCISRLLDGGTTPDGLPWIAMEYVDGEPLDVWCEEKGLDIEDRCRLIVLVCDAVAYAHRNLVVHGDLKPGNILVGSDGVPKLLDFGIAKLLRYEEDSAAGALTRGLIRPFTPEYASPEQMAGASIGTATDVYSLGAVLYELLSGVRPVVGAEPVSAAALRSGRDKRWVARLRGDLDNILAMALRAEPERRYLDISQLGADLRNHLEGLPVAARPDTLSYRATKFLGRHRLGVAAAAAVLVALAGGILVSTWQANRARLAEQEARRESSLARTERDRALAAERSADQARNAATAERNNAFAERERANSEAASARAVTDFLRNDLLGQANPDTQQTSPDLKVRTALDRAAGRMEGKFPGQPAVEADIRMTIGDSYLGLGVYPEAEKQHQRAFSLRRSALGENNRDTLEALNALAADYDREGKYDDSERAYNRLIAAARAAFGERDSLTLRATSDLAILYDSQKKYAKAVALERKSLAIQQKVRGPEHIDTLSTMNSLAADDIMLGQFDEAVGIYEPLLKILQRVLGPAQPRTLKTANNLAVALLGRGADLAAVEKLLLDTLEVQRRVLGPGHPDNATTLNNLGFLRMKQMRWEEAETFLTEAAAGRDRALGPLHPGALSIWVDIGTVRMFQGKLGEAEQTLRRACDAYAGAHPDVWRRYACEATLGRTLALQKRFAEAEPLLVSGYEGMRQRADTTSALSLYEIPEAAGWLAQLYTDEGKPELAERLRRTLSLKTAP